MLGDPDDPEEVLDEDISENADEAEDEFDAPMSEEGMGDLAAIDVLDPQEKDVDIEPTSEEETAHALELRRAIEAKLEERRLKEDLDYLDYDPEDV